MALKNKENDLLSGENCRFKDRQDDVKKHIRNVLGLDGKEVMKTCGPICCLEGH